MILALLGMMLAGCSASIRPKSKPVFFPPAPDLPRIQFLTSFSGLHDVEEQSWFNRFVVGEKQEVKLDKPYGVAIHDGKIYVCDTNSDVIVLDLKEKSFGPLKGASGAGLLKQPQNIVIEADGTKYVADPVRGQIVVFDAMDEYVRAYGTAGSWRPVDVAVFEDRIYVADPGNGAVKVFDKSTGEVVKSIGDHGDPSERLDRPTNLAFDRDGNLFVTDVGRFQILRFDRDGHFQGTIGKPGDNPGHFARPKGIAVDERGNLYAVDASFNNVQIFNREGRLLMFFGGSGETPGSLLLPAKVIVDRDNLSYFQSFVDSSFAMDSLVLVTSQFGDRRVNVFAVGREKGREYPSDGELLKQLDERRNAEREKSRMR